MVYAATYSSEHSQGIKRNEMAGGREARTEQPVSCGAGSGLLVGPAEPCQGTISFEGTLDLRAAGLI
jgi:hypothetical protein